MRAADLIPDTRPALRRALDAFLCAVHEEGMEELLSRGAAVALSGGADSVLLLTLANIYATHTGIVLAAVHVHHGIRGEEADRDEAFCRKHCEKMGIPLFVMHEDVPAYREEHGMGLEEAAREVRYACFERLLAEHGEYACILTAHNATDNLETLLLNLLRGSGLRGLCGIPPVRGAYLRPILSLSREEILAALGELGADCVTDSTNADTAIPRNYIREELIPHIRKKFPMPEHAAARLIKNLREEEEAAHLAATRLFAENEKDGKLPRALLASLEKATARRLIALLYEKAGGEVMIERTHYASLLSLLPGRREAAVAFPSGLVARLSDTSLSFCPKGEEKEEEPADYEIPLSLGRNFLGEGRGEIWIFEHPNDEFEKRSLFVYNLFIHTKIDSATILGRLTARNRRAGDCYRYRNMTRDVRRLMSGAHLPHRLRSLLPVICDEGGILWVPGFGVRDGETGGKALYVYYCNGERFE